MTPQGLEKIFFCVKTKRQLYTPSPPPFPQPSDSYSALHSDIDAGKLELKRIRNIEWLLWAWPCVVLMVFEGVNDGLIETKSIEQNIHTTERLCV
jgi:hypothetical protein